MNAEYRSDPVMYVDAMDVFLHRWFTTYEEASAALRALRGDSAVRGDSPARSDGFLLPYRHHFFLTEASGIRALGLDPADPDWERIGWDWVRPRDTAAWERLRLQRWIAG